MTKTLTVLCAVVLLGLSGCSTLGGIFGGVSCPKTSNVQMQRGTLASGKATTICVDVTTGESVNAKCCVDVNI